MGDRILIVSKKGNNVIRRYETYKDSGVEWIGEIPDGWDVKKLKYVAEICAEKPEDGARKVALENIESMSGHFIDTDTVFEGKGVAFKQGDILYGKLRPYLAKVWVTEFDGAAVGDFFVIKSLKHCKSSYLKYRLLSAEFTNIANGSTFGSKMPRVDREFISDLPFAIPPLSEQTTISSFLDHKTAEIDQLIASKEKLIALYEEEKTAIINHTVIKGLDPKVKTKPSGIEWLGDIPEHWEVKRLKRLCTIISKGTTPSTIGREILPSGDIRFIKAENVVNNAVVAEPDNFIDKKTNEIISRSQLEESDILFVIAGATIGKVAILTENFCPANTNQAVSFVRLADKNNVLFVWYWLQSDFIKKVLWLDAVQSAQPNLSMENLGNFYVPFPSAIEQSAIVTHIETECLRLDTIIDKFNKQIELFKEYRVTLISEVVTGKIDVRDEVAA
jgi:type I restriction enzyme S subunit